MDMVKSTELPKELPSWTSPWERDLYAHLTDHIENERALLEQYVAAAEATESRALAYLVNLLVEDERRHHILFSQLAASLKSDAELRSAEPEIPRMDFDRADPAAIRPVTERLLRRERRDLRELKDLDRKLRDISDTTLWGLLVAVMQRDTEKHIGILRFVQEHM